MRLPIVFTCCFTLLSFYSLAEQPDTRAHEHGVARLELFKLATELQISFYATGSDILGFEHQSQNQTEAETVKKAIALLAQPDKLFAIDGAKCDLKAHQSNLTELQKHSASKDEHSREHEDEHQHQHSGHSDIEASYQFSCKTATAPVTVKVHLFSLFPELQKINSSWITDRGQSAATLSATENRISLN